MLARPHSHEMAVLRCLLFDKKGQTNNEGVMRLLWESRRRASFPLLSSVQEPTAQRRVINSESFRESLSTERYQLSQSAALRESEPSDRKRTADPCARFGNRRRLITVSTMSLPSPPV